jgi:hypothetical protein
VRAPEVGCVSGQLQGPSAPQRTFPNPPLGWPQEYSKHQSLTVFFGPQVLKIGGV